MNKRRVPSITALEDKAQIVRDLAKSMNLAFDEAGVADRPGVVRFVFDLDFPDLQPFLSALPPEVFADRGVIGPGWPGQAGP